jgi:DNA-binding winged helix-turn-helix (wHTH) protein/tetratricopeptide (TPR) repeat protein
VADKHTSSPSLVYRFGVFQANLAARELRKHGVRVRLSGQPFCILSILLEERGETVTREELRQQLWPADTFVDFEHSLNTAVKKLRAALGDTPENSRYIETVPRVGYRFVAPVQVVAEPADLQRLKRILEIELPVAAEAMDAVPDPKLSEISGIFGQNAWKISVMAIAVVVAGLIGGIHHYRSQQARRLTDKDTIVLADFSNTTGDAIFDETLKQALSVELTQSPFLNLASDLKVSEMLRRMNHSPNDPLTREVAREVCLRLGGKAILVGSISSLGTHYLVGLQALSCASGDLLVASQVEAANKESVLKALDGVASQVRGKVGETLSSFERYDLPLDTTTRSLEALKAFSMGLRASRESGEEEAIPFFRDAIQLDPEFALAHVSLGRAYEDVGEDRMAVEQFTKAFDFRDRLSEREKYYITTLYNESVTGDMIRAKEAGELWTRDYPRDGIAREKLATVYGELGEIEKANIQAQEALRLDPDSAINVFNAVTATTSLNRFDQATQILDSARKRGLEGPGIHQSAYSLAFLRGDRAEMEREVAWAAEKGDTQFVVFSEHSDSEAYYGRLQEARKLSRRAVESATRNENKEAAALCAIAAALRELEIGNISLARQGVDIALALMPSKDVKLLAALGQARSGDTAHAKALIKELESANPSNTLIKSYWLPTLEASLEVHSGNPQTAVSLLQAAAPYELAETSSVSNLPNMYPTYVRGHAYLLAHNGRAAAAEFKKLLDHFGVVQNSILGALSRLQLARAEIMMGHIDAGQKQYNDFLTLWKDADPGIPILKQAKAEYAKLK